MPPINHDRLDNIEIRLDDVKDTLHANHVELLTKIDIMKDVQLDRIQRLEIKVERHAHNFGLASKIFLGGTGLTLLTWFKDFFKH